MVKYYEGWVYYNNLGEYHFYPHRTKALDEFSVVLTDNGVSIFENIKSYNFNHYPLRLWFSDLRNPTIEELTLFELEFGVDISYPLSMIFGENNE